MRPGTINFEESSKVFIIWEKLYDLYKEAYTPWEWHETLFATAEEEGLICFSSPFDKTAIDLLESLGASA